MIFLANLSSILSFSSSRGQLQFVSFEVANLLVEIAVLDIFCTKIALANFIFFRKSSVGLVSHRDFLLESLLKFSEFIKCLFVVWRVSDVVLENVDISSNVRL